MQNNMFCNVLIDSELSDTFVCEEYLQFYGLLFVHKVGCFH